MSTRYKIKRRARYYRAQRRCQHVDENSLRCSAEGIPCFLEMWNDQPDEYYCPEHCHRAGYCSCCGQFWGGVESFEFRRSGLCDICHDQVMADMADMDEDETALFRLGRLPMNTRTEVLWMNFSPIENRKSKIEI